MADLMRLGVVLDPTQTGQGATAITKQLENVNKSADKMQAGVTAAANKAAASLTASGKAGTTAGTQIATSGSTASKGLAALEAASKRAQSALQSMGGMGEFLKRSLEFALGGIIEKMVEFGAEAILMFPKELITRGLEYNDTIAKATNQIAGMISASRPELIHNFADALNLAGDVVAALQVKVQQYHFSSLQQLNDMFTSVSTGTSTWGITLQKQVDIAGAMLAAFRAKNVDGQQASRDAIDVLMGRGERVVAAKEIFQGGDLEKLGEMIKQIEAGTMGADAAVKLIEKDTGAYASASEHSLQILSVTWEAFLQSIDKGLGGATSPLYDDMVTQINRVRAVINAADFGGAMKPLVDLLRQAVQLAGDLAVTLATDPKDFFNVLTLGMNAVWTSTVEYLVGQIPKVIPAFIDALKAIAPVLINLMFQAAAILTTAVQGVFAQIDAKTKLPQANLAVAAATGALGSHTISPPSLDNIMSGHPIQGWEDDQEALRQKVGQAIAARDALQNTAATGPSAADQQKQIMDSLANNTGRADQLKDQLFSGLNLPKPADIQTGAQAWAAYSDAMKNVAVNAKAIADQELVASRMPHDESRNPLMNTPGKPHQEGPDKAALINQQEVKISEDQYQALVAQGTANEKLIAQAEALVKIDEYRKSLLEHLTEKKGPVSAEDLANVNALTSRFADAQNAVTDQAVASKELQDQINAAEDASAKAQARVTSIQGDPFTSQLNKRPELLASYDEEISKLQEVIRLNQESIDSGRLKDQNAIASRQKEITKAQSEIATVQNSKKLQTDGGVFTQDLTKYMDGLGSLGSQTAGIITGTLNEALSSASDNIMKLIDGTQTWGQTFEKIGADIMNTLEQLVIKMLLTQALQASLGGLGVGGGSIMGYHSGGMVGSEATFTRSWPKFHSGGTSQDETMAVVKKDESVLTPGQMKAISGAGQKKSGGGPTVHLHVNNFSDPTAYLQHARRNPDGLMNIVGSNQRQFRTTLGLPS